MAQTTEYYSFADCMISYSTNGTVWVEIDGESNLVEWDGFERAHEFTPTFDGDTMILTTGKREGGSVKVRVIYGEGATTGADVAQDAYEADSAFYLRWSPRGGTSGQKMFTSSAGRVIKPVYPAGEAGSAEAILCEIELACSNIAVSTVV